MSLPEPDNTTATATEDEKVPTASQPEEESAASTSAPQTAPRQLSADAKPFSPVGEKTRMEEVKKGRSGKKKGASPSPEGIGDEAVDPNGGRRSSGRGGKQQLPAYPMPPQYDTVTAATLGPMFGGLPYPSFMGYPPNPMMNPYSVSMMMGAPMMAHMQPQVYVEAGAAGAKGQQQHKEKGGGVTTAGASGVSTRAGSDNSAFDTSVGGSGPRITCGMNSISQKKMIGAHIFFGLPLAGSSTLAALLAKDQGMVLFSGEKALSDAANAAQHKKIPYWEERAVVLAALDREIHGIKSPEMCKGLVVDIVLKSRECINFLYAVLEKHGLRIQSAIFVEDSGLALDRALKKDDGQHRDFADYTRSKYYYFARVMENLKQTFATQNILFTIENKLMEVSPSTCATADTDARATSEASKEEDDSATPGEEGVRELPGAVSGCASTNNIISELRTILSKSRMTSRLPLKKPFFRESSLPSFIADARILNEVLSLVFGLLQNTRKHTVIPMQTPKTALREKDWSGWASSVAAKEQLYGRALLHGKKCLLVYVNGDARAAAAASRKEAATPQQPQQHSRIARKSLFVVSNVRSVFAVSAELWPFAIPADNAICEATLLDSLASCANDSALLSEVSKGVNTNRLLLCVEDCLVWDGTVVTHRPYDERVSFFHQKSVGTNAFVGPEPATANNTLLTEALKKINSHAVVFHKAVNLTHLASGGAHKCQICRVATETNGIVAFGASAPYNYVSENQHVHEATACRAFSSSAAESASTVHPLTEDLWQRSHTSRRCDTTCPCSRPTSRLLSCTPRPPSSFLPPAFFSGCSLRPLGITTSLSDERHAWMVRMTTPSWPSQLAASSRSVMPMCSSSEMLSGTVLSALPTLWIFHENSPVLRLSASLCAPNDAVTSSPTRYCGCEPLAAAVVVATLS